MDRRSKLQEGVIKRTVAKWKARRAAKKARRDAADRRMDKAEANITAKRGVDTQIPQTPDQQRQMDSEGAIRW